MRVYRSTRRDEWRKVERVKIVDSNRLRRMPWPLFNYEFKAETKYRAVVGRSKYDGTALREIRADGTHR
jgi:hypothetical protein